MNGEDYEGTDEPIDAGTFEEATGSHALRRTTDWGRSMTAYIVKHPEICLAAALALGVAVGVVVKRR